MKAMQWLLPAVSATVLAACTVSDGNSAAPADEGSPTATVTNVSAVTREQVAAPTPAPTPTVVQTQPGPNGTNVTVNRVGITGDILTIAITAADGRCCSSPDVSDISLIDDATSQRLGVLRDDAGNWMAGPLRTGGSRLTLARRGSTQIFLRFPAPSPETETVSLTIPEVAPFDALPVAR